MSLIEHIEKMGRFIETDNLLMKSHSFISGSFLANSYHDQQSLGDLDIFIYNCFDNRLAHGELKKICDKLLNCDEDDKEQIIKDFVNLMGGDISKLVNISFMIKNYDVIGTSKAITLSMKVFNDCFGNSIKLHDDIKNKISNVQFVIQHSQKQTPKQITKDFDFLHAMPYYDLSNNTWYLNDTLKSIIEYKILIYNKYRSSKSTLDDSRFRKFKNRGWIPSDNTKKLFEEDEFDDISF